MLELWWQALPEAFAWDQLKLMRSWGLDVAWRKEAWRVWWRFQQVKQPLPEYPRRWVSLCQQVAQERDYQINKVEAQVARWAGVYLRQEGSAKQVPTAQRVEFKCTAGGLRRKPLQVM